MDMVVYTQCHTDHHLVEVTQCQLIESLYSKLIQSCTLCTILVLHVHPFFVYRYVLVLCVGFLTLGVKIQQETTNL